MTNTADTERKRLICLGAGGHARGVIELIQSLEHYELVGLIDPSPELQGTTMLGVRVLGSDDRLGGLRKEGVTHAVVGLGSVGNAAPRRRVYEQALSAGFTMATLIHPKAIVSAYATLGPGTVVMATAVVGTNATIGANTIINTAAIVEHDCVIGDHVHVATGACLTGNVHVDTMAHVGARAVVRQGLTIGAGAIVGVGAAVVCNVPSGVTVVGVPARPRGSA